jgi:hypothetical protein
MFETLLNPPDVLEDKTMFWEFGGKNMIPMCIEK